MSEHESFLQLIFKIDHVRESIIDELWYSEKFALRASARWMHKYFINECYYCAPSCSKAKAYPDSRIHGYSTLSIVLMDLSCHDKATPAFMRYLIRECGALKLNECDHMEIFVHVHASCSDDVIDELVPHLDLDRQRANATNFQRVFWSTLSSQCNYDESAVRFCWETLMSSTLRRRHIGDILKGLARDCSRGTVHNIRRRLKAIAWLRDVASDFDNCLSIEEIYLHFLRGRDSRAARECIAMGFEVSLSSDAILQWFIDNHSRIILSNTIIDYIIQTHGYPAVELIDRVVELFSGRERFGGINAECVLGNHMNNDNKHSSVR